MNGTLIAAIANGIIIKNGIFMSKPSQNGMSSSKSPNPPPPPGPS